MKHASKRSALVRAATCAFPLHWEGDFETWCTASIPGQLVGSDQGGVTIEENVIAYEFDNRLRGEFCAEADFLHLEGIGNSEFAVEQYFYVLRRN